MDAAGKPPANQRWVWSAFPFSGDRWIRLPCQMNERGRAGRVFDLMDSMVFRGKNAPKTLMLYMPTDDDFALLKRLYPNDDPHHPEWRQIEVDLVVDGKTPDSLAKCTALVLMVYLRQLDAKRPKQNNTHIPDDPITPDYHEEILQALLELNAFGRNSRRPTREVCKRALGPDCDPAILKRPIKRLCDMGLVQTKDGKGGGVWLTPKGREMAEEIAKR